MIQRQAMKVFEIDEYSTAAMWYVVRVRHAGKFVEEFRAPTMEKAVADFRAAGYKYLPLVAGD